MKRILVYGFSAWGTLAVNISSRVVQRLASLPGVTAIVLQTRFDENQLLEMVSQFDGDYVLGLGQYPRGRKIRIEQRGFNRKKVGRVIVPIEVRGESDYEVTWHIAPTATMEVTDDPGSFVCNFSMYHLGKWAKLNQKKFAFLHIPKTFPEDEAVKIVIGSMQEQSI